MKKLATIGLYFILMAVFSSCATQNLLQKSRPEKTNTKFEDSVFRSAGTKAYTLKKDDKINISVWGHDDLSVGSIYGIYNSNEVYGKWLMLDIDGNVNIPQLGKMNLLGLTIKDAEAKLTGAYEKQIRNPIVEVKVLNREITVLGELKSPGKFLIEKEENNLIDMIGRAGDFDFYANKKKVQIVRQVNGKPLTYTVDMTKMDPAFSAGLALLPGDVVYVPSRKGKHWDKRAGSTVVPIASAISTIVLVAGLLK